jgi:hypothetical protein
MILLQKFCSYFAETASDSGKEIKILNENTTIGEYKVEMPDGSLGTLTLTIVDDMGPNPELTLKVGNDKKVFK